jgi:hypothetical protein
MVKYALHCRFDSPTMLSKNTARMRDEGKAAGCVPLAALLFEKTVNTRSAKSNWRSVRLWQPNLTPR